MMTPLPAASPSALITTGKEKRFSAWRASANEVTSTERAVGMPARAQNCLAKIFDPSRRAARGTDDVQLAFAEMIDHAGHQGRFRAYHGQIHLVGLSEICVGGNVCRRGDAGGHLSHTRIAGAGPDLFHRGRFG